MHIAAATTTSASSQPPQWTAGTGYESGHVVWSAGTFWRCEAQHISGSSRHSSPESSLNLWTPLSSNGVFPPPQPSFLPQNWGSKQYFSYGQQASFQQSAQPRSYAVGPSHSTGDSREGQPPLLHPQPKSMPNRPPAVHSVSDDGSASSSTDTVTVDEKSSLASPQGGMDYFQAKAAESLRYLMIQRESSAERDGEQLKQELKGKKVWKIGAVGVYAYSLDPSVEKVKERIWRDHWKSTSRKEWISVARARTDYYESDTRSVKPLLMWKLVERGDILPHDVLPIGSEENGALLYAARAWWEGGVHLGKAGRHLTNCASLSYAGSEHPLDIYEVLCGPADPSLIKWMTYRHGETAQVDGWQPVEAGREKDGTALLLAKGGYDNGEHPGKCLVNDDHACIGFGGGELWVRPFQVLAYCSSSRR